MWKKAEEGLSNKLIKETIKFEEGFVMVWGCIFWDGPRYTCKINRRMDGDLYMKIMKEDLKASMDYYGKTPQNIVF